MDKAGLPEEVAFPFFECLEKPWTTFMERSDSGAGNDSGDRTALAGFGRWGRGLKDMLMERSENCYGSGKDTVRPGLDTR